MIIMSEGYFHYMHVSGRSLLVQSRQGAGGEVWDGGDFEWDSDFREASEPEYLNSNISFFFSI